mgnify:CR=1 FL=1|tara:strand:- start:9 stop:311 length:303 start_codon:yes stop_codon:yes gene_type:complete
MILNIKKNIFLLACTFFIFYFFFNLFDGERGLISYFEKKEELKELKVSEYNLINKIDDLELRNSLLSDNLDLDYIEILIRDKFVYGKKGEKLYIIRPDED